MESRQEEKRKERKRKENVLQENITSMKDLCFAVLQAPET